MDAYKEAIRLGLDFFTVSDHSNTMVDGRGAPTTPQNPYYQAGFTDEHWNDTKDSARKINEEYAGRFVALPAYEFSKNNNPDFADTGQGHMNVFNTDEWASAYPKVNDYFWLFDGVNYDETMPPYLEKTLPQAKPAADSTGKPLGGDKIWVQFNHPGKNQYNNWLDLANPRSVSFPGSKEPSNYNQYVRLFEWTNAKTDTFAKLLNLGWKVAPVRNSDTHGVNGMAKSVNQAVGLLAPGLTYKDITDAIYERRVYACGVGNPRLELDFRICDGQREYLMGSDFDERPSGELTVKVHARDRGFNGAAPDEIEFVDFIGGNYNAVAPDTAHTILGSLPFGADVTEFEFTFPPENNTYDFYYLHVYKKGQEDKPFACSAPIWMDNE
jgi:hypothetical protein